MRRTSLGLLMLSVGWGCFPLALVAGTPAPAFVGIVLVAIVLGSRARAPELRVHRELPERIVEGVPFDVRTTVEGPSRVPLMVIDEPPMGTRVLARNSALQRGSSHEHKRLQSDQPGGLRWHHVRVRYQDPWGLVEDELVIPLAESAKVMPDASRANVRAGMQAEQHIGGRLRRLMAVDSEPEFERLREWQEGDRLRDVDWAHTALLGQLITREMAPAPILPVVMMLDVGATMRRDRRHSKMTTCVHAALALVGSARRAGMPTGIVTWSEDGVETQVSVTKGRRAIAQTILRLGDLPPARRWDDVEARAPGAHDFEPQPQERPFLDTTAGFLPTAYGASTPIEAALAAVSRVSPQPSLVFIFADFEERPSLAAALAKRLRQRGHRPIAIAFANGAHHYALSDVDASATRRLVAWRRNREAVRVALHAQRVPFVVLGPHVDRAAVQEVVRSAA